MKMRSTIGCYFLIFLYLGVLMHNTVPHEHLEKETELTTTHQHQHGTDGAHQQHHSENSKNDGGENTAIPRDLTSLLTHADLGTSHFTNFTGASFHFAPLLFIALWLLSSRWNLLPLGKITKPPEPRPDQQLQRITLSALSHRGPPSFS